MACLRKVADSYSRNEMVRVEGVADVALTGDETKSMIISTDPYKLDAFGLSVSDLSSKIQEHTNSISGGSITDNGRQYIIKGVSTLADEKDFQNLIVGYKSIDSNSTTDTAMASM